MFVVYGIKASFDFVNTSNDIFDNSEYETDTNLTDIDTDVPDDATQGLNKLQRLLEDIGSFALLQVDGAPFQINFVMGFIAFMLWLSFILLIIAFVREYVGFT